MPKSAAPCSDGLPAAALERVADEEGADFLAVGTRGRGAMRSALLGSVAHEMSAISACPVIVGSPHVADRSRTE